MRLMMFSTSLKKVIFSHGKYPTFGLFLCYTGWPDPDGRENEWLKGNWVVSNRVKAGKLTTTTTTYT